MTRELTLLISLIAVGAGWVLVHLMLLVRTTRAARLSTRLRLLAWLPPATPVVGWAAGARALGILWLVHALLYFWLRTLA
jgi:hypothetical protein